ncbi:MAG: hypothetical protein V3V14_14350 [Saprospiraceae bacterium]
MSKLKDEQYLAQDGSILIASNAYIHDEDGKRLQLLKIPNNCDGPVGITDFSNNVIISSVKLSPVPDLL